MVEEPPQQPAFGSALRRLRVERKLSLGDLAARASYSKGHLSKVENGAKAPSMDLARRLDAVMDTPETLASLVPAHVAGDDSPPARHVDDLWVLRLAADGRSEFHAVNNQSLLTAGASNQMTWVIPAGTDAAASSDGDAGLPAFRAMFDQLRLLGQTSDPASITQILIAVTGSLRIKAEHAPERSRSALLRMGARFAEYTGWMAQEKGNDPAAQWWTDYAVEMAQAAGDLDLAAYGLVRQAEMALYRGDPLTTVELATRARHSSSAARIQCFAAQREAQGHALAGDVRACHGALERATDLMHRVAADAPADGETPLGSTNMADPIAFATGWSLHDLGSPERAVAILEVELDRIPATALRARARCAARLALSLGSIREIDRAGAVLAPVFDHASLIDSATVRHDLIRLNHTLNRWHNDAAVRRIAAGMATALRSSHRH